MKNIIKTASLFSLLTFLLTVAAGAKNFDKEGKIEKEFEINKNTRVEFANKSSDLQVKTWNKQAVKLECFYKIKANDEEDIQKTIEALENIEAKNSSSLLSIKTGIFTSINSTVVSGIINKIAATLSTGVVVNLSEYEIEYILTLPADQELMIQQKYSDINMPDFTGKLELDLYDVDMRAGALKNANSLKAKYSDLTIKTLGNCETDIYDTDVELESMGNLTLTSKYSKFETKVAGTVTIDSYDDKLFFTQLSSIKGNSKYSDISIGNIEFGNLDLYDCELQGKNCGTLNLLAKYSGIVMNNINIFEFPDSYDNKVEAGSIGEFSTVSKYTEFQFDHVSGMIDFESYDDKLFVSSIDENFYTIKIKGKYAKVDLRFDGSPRYFLDVNFKYTDYELPSNILFSDVDTKSGKFVASGRTEGLKSTDAARVHKDQTGIRKADIGKISIEQYDGTLKVR